MQGDDEQDEEQAATNDLQDPVLHVVVQANNPEPFVPVVPGLSFPLHLIGAGAGCTLTPEEALADVEMELTARDDSLIVLAKQLGLLGVQRAALGHAYRQHQRTSAVPFLQQVEDRAGRH